MRRWHVGICIIPTGNFEDTWDFHLVPGNWSRKVTPHPSHLISKHLQACWPPSATVEPFIMGWEGLGTYIWMLFHTTLGSEAISHSCVRLPLVLPISHHTGLGRFPEAVTSGSSPRSKAWNLCLWIPQSILGFPGGSRGKS